MDETETKTDTSPAVDLARLERTLQASIKLMKRGRREMERMRRKSGRQEQADHEHASE